MKLRISDPAWDDLLEIWEYIAADNEQAADRLATGLQQLFGRLVKFPQLGRERPDLISGIRSFTFGRYVVFYQPRADVLEIVRVRHGATDLNSLFTEE